MIEIKEIEHITQEYLDNLNDPKFNQFLSTHNIPQTLPMVKAWVKDKKPFGIYANNNLVGTLRLLTLPNVGIAIFRDHQRKGYALSALNIVKKDKMIAGIDDKNTASIRLFKKAGFSEVKVYQFKKGLSE